MGLFPLIRPYWTLIDPKLYKNNSEGSFDWKNHFHREIWPKTNPPQKKNKSQHCIQGTHKKLGHFFSFHSWPVLHVFLQPSHLPLQTGRKFLGDLGKIQGRHPRKTNMKPEEKGPLGLLKKNIYKLSSSGVQPFVRFRTCGHFTQLHHLGPWQIRVEMNLLKQEQKLHSLKLTAKAPEHRVSRKETIAFQPSIFQVRKC